MFYKPIAVLAFSVAIVTALAAGCRQQSQSVLALQPQSTVAAAEKVIYYPNLRTKGNNGEDIVFIDPLHGWKMVNEEVAAGSEAAAILKTEDGGESWIEISKTRTNDGNHDKQKPELLPLTGLKTGITFSDRQTGWIGFDTPTSVPELYVSHDEGKTWQYQELSVLEHNEDAMFIINPPSFFTKQDGIIIVANVNSLLYVTHDGGKNWALVEEPSRKGSDGNLSWDFTGTDRNYDHVMNGNVTINGITWITKDGGLTWSENKENSKQSYDINKSNIK